MPFSAGDTFINDSASGPLPHLWIVISDTQQSVDKIVIVNITTWRKGGDESCLLYQGDHPFINRQTYVNYQDAKIVKLERLDELEGNGSITRRESLSSNILAKIREGAMTSDLTIIKIQKILEDQNLI